MKPWVFAATLSHLCASFASCHCTARCAAFICKQQIYLSAFSRFARFKCQNVSFIGKRGSYFPFKVGDPGLLNHLTARRLCVHLNAFHVQSYFFFPAAPTVIRGPPNEYAQPATLLDSSTQWNVDLDVTHLTEKHWCIFLLRNSISTHKRACSEIRLNPFLHCDKGKAIIADVCQVLN